MDQITVENGDYVRVGTLPSYMDHFQKGEAVVVASYFEQYGRGSKNSFTIFFEDSGAVSWYEAEHLEVIEKGRHDLLTQWKEALEKRRDQEKDLDWIFSEEHRDPNWELPGASAEVLGAAIGIGNLWGSRGEGITYLSNHQRIGRIAKVFLAKDDGREQFIKFAAEAKETLEKQGILMWSYKLLSAGNDNSAEYRLDEISGDDL